MNSKHYPEFTRYISFQVAKYWYAIPVTDILKIVNCPPPSQGGIVGLGLVQLGPHTIQLIDLHQMFEAENQAPISTSASFLVVLHPQDNILWGITLETPPDLIELSSGVLKPVSLDEHFSAQSPWITHVGVVAEQNYQRTFLRLDLKALTQQKAKQLMPNLGS